MLISIIRCGSSMSRLRTFFSRTRSRSIRHRQHRNSYCRCRQKDSTVGIVVVSDIFKTFRCPLSIFLTNEKIAFNHPSKLIQCCSAEGLVPSDHPQRVFRQAATSPPDNQRKVQSEFVIIVEVGNAIKHSGWSREQVPELG